MLWGALRHVIRERRVRPPTVALFDIDGTLVKSDGVGRRSINRAFEAEFGRADACDGFRFDGLTDR